MAVDDMYVNTLKSFIEDISELNKVILDNHGGTKTVKDLLKDSNIKNGIKETNIIKTLLTKTNRDIDNKKDLVEITSWIESLPALAKALTALPQKVLKAQIILEASYGSSERADVVIVGTKNRLNKRTKVYESVPVVLFIENKRWKDLNNNCEPISDLCVFDKIFKKHLVHPCIQVERYKYLIKHTNKFVQDNKAELYTAVFMQTTKKGEVKNQYGPFDKRYEDRFKETPVFIDDNGESIKENLLKNIGNLSEYINNIIDDGQAHLAEEIYESEMHYSEKYREVLGNLFGNHEELLKLLDEQQIAIFDEILARISSSHKMAVDQNRRLLDDNNKTVYIIEGNPGTGKSFLAVALLAYLYQTREKAENGDKTNDYPIKYILKNADPRKYYREYYKNKNNRNDKIKEFIDNVIDNTITFGGKNVLDFEYECLICDEAHRMLEGVFNGTDKNIEKIIKKSNVSVFFYDEKQSVSVQDYITKERIRKYVEKNIGAEHVICKELTYQHRSSASFLDFVNRLLYSHGKGNKNALLFKESKEYTVKIVKTPEELFEILQRSNNVHSLEDIKKGMHPSRVLSGKGRTKGKDWEWDIRNPKAKTIGPFRNSKSKKPIFAWNLKYGNKNMSFWLDSDSINQVGCVDTSQGLDFEYVGVIIAPDLVYQDREIKVILNDSEGKNGHQQGYRKEYPNNKFFNIKDSNLTGEKCNNLIEAQEEYGKKYFENLIQDWAETEADKEGFKDIWERFKSNSKDVKELYRALGEHLQKKIIRNTYYVLLSRGEKGCFIYCCDEELEKFLVKDCKIPYYYRL